MTLDQLRIFLAVAAREHVTRAAEDLHLTQSAVSAALMALEDRHGVPLFDRIGRGIVLTEAGRHFVPHAQAVLQRAAEAATLLADLSNRVGGSLRIVASQTVASYWLPPYLMRYRSQHPQVDLQFHPGNTSTAVAAVLEGQADLAVVEGTVTAPGVVTRTVAEDRLAVLVGTAHPWADGRPLETADLPASPWVLRETGSGTRQDFDDELARRGLSPADLQVLMDLPTNEACIAAVEVGTAATLLSRRAAAPHLAQGLLVQAGLDLPPRRFSVVRHRDRHQSRASLAFQALVAA